MKTFLVYWTSDQLTQSIKLGSLPHAGSGQLNRVSVGDRLWICGRTDGTPELFTVGYLDVSRKLTESQAQSEMRKRIPGYEVWTAPLHVVAKKGEECRPRLVSLKPLYAKLTFESKTSDRLLLTNGHPNPQQLQTMRTLTKHSSDLMWTLWRARTPSKAGPAFADDDLLDLDALDAERTTMARLEQKAARALLLQGKATAECSFCGRDLPASLMIAAHIKPRSTCTLEEKKAIDVNIIGLCKFGCDDLFERGYVEAINGIVVRGKALPVTPAVSAAVLKLVDRPVRGWTSKREAFFQWRRTNR